jgi:large subunit ribosomal protein L29|tara:strand:+ start:109 stop:294 length:186 start_codon:yes stop_codon:yes gene_type:complete
MEQQEIVKLSDSDLNNKIADMQIQLSNLKFNHKVSPVENPLRIKVLRRNVARLLTELSKRS